MPRRAAACLALAVALLAGCAPAGDRADDTGRTDDTGQADDAGRTDDAGRADDADDADDVEPGTRPDGGRASEDAAQVRQRGEALDLGGTAVHVLVQGGTLAVDRPDTRSAHLVVTPDGDAPPALLVAFPPGTVVTAPGDGSLEVRSGDGEPGGVVPVLRSTAGATADDVVRVDAPPAGTDDDAPTRPLEAWLGWGGVLGTDWADRTATEGGLSIAVEPAAWARRGGLAGTAAVWAHLERHEPDATGPGMHDQLVCHAVGAPDKATWNLEPWRPDVGLLRTMAARCNPT